MSTKISIGLSAKEFREAARQIEQYKKELNQKVALFVHRLADEGVQLAKIKIMQYPAMDTGELLSSIQDEPGAMITDGSQWVIYTGCEWAPYVEFGTGVVGAQNPHPDTSIANWKYDVNGHGESGWIYCKAGEGGEEEKHWTKGMPSRPFMYETAKDLRHLIPKIAREVFGK